ncbi:MAG: DNA polymerase IV [Planctomycetes bacterium]|nr:DNA polymerase IV [Planctomycetota bacterium]
MAEEHDPRLAILHADMDAFYAAVEVLDDPSLAGKPVIVGHPGRRGVVATASYEARRFGVRSAMASLEAMRRCPEGVWRAPRMERYAELSSQIREIMLRFTPLVEPLSLDEAFLDVRESLRLFGGAVAIARALRAAVREETKLTVSVGVAENLFLAKIASDANKPDGLTVIDAGRGAEYLSALPVSRLWGVGPRTAERLEALGLRRIGDIPIYGEARLVRLLGEAHGRHLHRLALGLDDRRVTPERAAKSISTESTFAEDLHSRADMERFLFQAAETVAEALRRDGLRARTVELKVRTASFRTQIRSRTLDSSTDLAERIYAAAVELFETRIDLGGEGVRLLGVGASQLQNAGRPAQGELFPHAAEGAGRRVALLLDRIRDKLGPEAARRARLVAPPKPDKTE